jgi:hypothetical protein
VCQPLELALHDPHLVLQHPPSLDDVCCARVQNFFIQELFLIILLLGIFHLGVIVAAGLLAVITLVLLLVSGLTLQVVEVLEGRHDGREFETEVTIGLIR